MTRYAAETSVSVEKSRMEIEQILRRYKADGFMYGYEGNRSQIAFRLAGRYIRFKLELPDQNEREFTHHSKGPRVPAAAEAAWEQACRQRWRALALVIKAKLEAVSAGITTVEDEFLAHTVLANNATVGEWARDQVRISYETGAMPAMLPGPGS